MLQLVRLKLTRGSIKLLLNPDIKGHSYPDNSNNDEFPVYVESSNREDKLGNKNPLQLSKLFKNVKGIHERRRINASKIMLVFKQAADANNFLTNDCLDQNYMRAYIPAASVERVGVVRYIPKETTNQELHIKLTSDAEIIAVRRFMKKNGTDLVPLTTISVTFAELGCHNTFIQIIGGTKSMCTCLRFYNVTNV